MSMRKGSKRLSLQVSHILLASRWTWSTVFHVRDTWLTERLDYVSAIVLVSMSLECTLVRVLWPRFKLVLSSVSALLAALVASHLRYMLLFKFDYGWNLKCVLVNPLHTRRHTCCLLQVLSRIRIHKLHRVGGVLSRCQTSLSKDDVLVPRARVRRPAPGGEGGTWGPMDQTMRAFFRNLGRPWTVSAVVIIFSSPRDSHSLLYLLAGTRLPTSHRTARRSRDMARSNCAPHVPVLPLLARRCRVVAFVNSSIGLIGGEIHIPTGIFVERANY